MGAGAAAVAGTALVAGNPGGAALLLGGAEVPTLALPLPRLVIFASLCLLSSPRHSAAWSLAGQPLALQKEKKRSVTVKLRLFAASARQCVLPDLRSADPERDVIPERESAFGSPSQDPRRQYAAPGTPATRRRAEAQGPEPPAPLLEHRSSQKRSRLGQLLSETGCGRSALAFGRP